MIKKHIASVFILSISLTCTIFGSDKPTDKQEETDNQKNNTALIIGTVAAGTVAVIGGVVAYKYFSKDTTPGSPLPDPKKPNFDNVTQKTLDALKNLNGEVRFYRENDAFCELSNFYNSPITIDGKVWPTVEHYFQAMKFSDGAKFAVTFGPENQKAWINFVQNEICGCKTPKEALDMAKGNKLLPYNFNNKPQQPLNLKPLIRNDWHTGKDPVKDQVMLAALKAKFDQNPGLKNLLLATGNSRIIEDSKTDKYWGIGADGRGQNKLGQMLEQLRTEFRK